MGYKMGVELCMNHFVRGYRRQTANPKCRHPNDLVATPSFRAEVFTFAAIA